MAHHAEVVGSVSGRNLAWDRIDPAVYVSTGAVHYAGEPWGERWQFETMIFGQRVRQVIHGSASSLPAPGLEARALRVHRHIVRNLRALRDRR